MKTILTNDGNHSETTVEQLQALAAKSGATLELIPSRRGNFEIVKLNGQAVAKLFNSAIEAFAFNAATA